MKYTDFWLKRYPTFEEDLPLHCICGAAVYEVTPFIASRSVGISTGECECGAKDATTIHIPRTAKMRDDMLGLLGALGGS